MAKKRPWEKRALWNWAYVDTESRRLYQSVCILLWAILLYLFIHRNVVAVGIVTDQSMIPTLPPGYTCLINRYLYHFTHPQRGDVVVMRRHNLNPELYVKRVVGLSGETLQIANGTVLINGDPLEEPYAIGKTYPEMGPIVIERNCYFVLGDNRMESEDSRRFGCVPLRQIEGKIKPGEWFPFR